MLCKKTAFTSNNKKIKWEDECFVLKWVGVWRLFPTSPALPQVLGGNIFLSFDKILVCITPTEKKLWWRWIDQKSGRSSGLDPIVVSVQGVVSLSGSRSLRMPCQQGALFVEWRLVVWSCLKAAVKPPLLFSYCLFSGCAFSTDNVSSVAFWSEVFNWNLTWEISASLF